MQKKFIAIVVAAFLFAVVAVPAQAAIDAATQAKIDALMAQIAALSGGTTSTSGSYQFNTNLTIGSRGADVTALQNLLISKGYAISAGATGYFGPQTQTAVKAWQVAADISPAAGYVGPISRAALNGMSGTATGGTPVSGCANGAMYSSTTGKACGTTSQVVNDGTDGSVTITYSPYAPSSQTLKKGDTSKAVIAVKASATSGAVNLNRLDVEFSDRPWLYFSKITLKDDAGNVVATKAITGAGDADEITVGSDYKVRFDNINYKVDPSQDRTLIAYLDVLAASDKINNNVVYLGIPTGNIRSINGKGYTDSLGIGSGTGAGVTSSTGVALTLSTSGSTGTVTTRVSPSSPLKRNVATSATAVTSDVVLGVFGIKVQNQDATINSLNFNINNSTGIATSTLYSNVRLYDASGKLIAGANSLSAGASTFNNLTVPVKQDVWTDFTLKADVNINQTGVSASSTLVGGSIVGTDVNYNTLTVSSASNQTSADNVYLTSGITVSGLTPSFGDCTAGYGTSSGNTACTMTFSFTVTNVGNSDVYISKTPSVALSTSTVPATSSSTLTTINIAAVAGDTSASYDISSGASRTFTYQGTFSKTGGAVALETFKITAIGFGTSATDGTADTVTSGVGNQTVTASSNRANLINYGLEPLYLSKSL